MPLCLHAIGPLDEDEQAIEDNFDMGKAYPQDVVKEKIMQAKKAACTFSSSNFTINYWNLNFMQFKKPINDYSQKADQYAQHKIQGALTLAYREFGKLFSKYIKDGNKALDFGCGTGRSTRYLKETGFEADGVDISLDMIAQAKNEDPDGCYKLIENGKIPTNDLYYDLVFSTLVLFEIPTLQEMLNSFREIYRTMRGNGMFMVLTVSDDFYNHDWASINTDYPQNKNPAPGDIVTIKLKETGLELNDYYWRREDYRKVAEEAGFSIIEELLPRASQDDNTFAWISEKDFPPFVIFVMKKSVHLP